MAEDGRVSDPALKGIEAVEQPGIGQNVAIGPGRLRGTEERVEGIGIGRVGKMIRCLNVKVQPVKIIGVSEPAEDQLTGR